MNKTLFSLLFLVGLMACSSGQDDVAPAADTAGESTAADGGDRPGGMTEATHRNMPAMNMGDGDDVSAFTAPIDYIEAALGSYHWAITTGSEQAQNYFDQGMQLRWGYNMNEAARSMAEARRLDPECAMCYWGEAFGLGSFLNGGMSATKAPYAHEAIEKAVALADNVTEVEREMGLSRITVVTTGTPQVLEQIKAQLDRLVPVHWVSDLTLAGPHVERELALVKVAGSGEKRVESLRIADIFRARVVDSSHDHFTFEMTGKSDKLDVFIELMRPLGLVDVSRTGVVAIARGPAAL